MWLRSKKTYTEKEIHLMILGLFTLAKYNVAIDFLGEDIEKLIKKLMEEIKEK